MLGGAALGGEVLARVTTATLYDGPNRVDLRFTIPNNDGYDEYYLTIEPESDENDDELQFRRASNWDGWSGYSNPSGDGIDLLQGGRMDDSASSDFSDYYYYVFDIKIGAATTQVTSPRSHDVT